MSEAVTIDNFPIEASIQWAESQEVLETKYVKESSFVSKQADLLVNTPEHAKLEALFGTHIKAPTWAFFIPPEGFFSQSNRFFSNNIIPEVNSEESLDRLEEITEDIKRAHKMEKLKEHDILKKFLSTATELEKMLTEMRSRVLQYRKG